MKSGAGDDLLGDLDDEQDDQDESDDVDAEDDAGVDGLLDDRDQEASDDEADERYPWKLRRDTVKSDRPEVLQLHVREATVGGERDLLRAVEDELTEDVYTLDLREAAYLVAQQHPKLVADQLREWGYDLE